MKADKSLIHQSVVSGNMVRVTRTGTLGESDSMFAVTIGINFAKGNTHPDYREFTARQSFLLAQDAHAYGVRLANGATPDARND